MIKYSDKILILDEIEPEDGLISSYEESIKTGFKKSLNISRFYKSENGGFTFRLYAISAYNYILNYEKQAVLGLIGKVKIKLLIADDKLFLEYQISFLRYTLILFILAISNSILIIPQISSEIEDPLFTFVGVAFGMPLLFSIIG